jgi:hypothetical protein
LQPISAESVDVDPSFPVDCIWPVRADRHGSTQRGRGVQYKLRLFSEAD